MTRRQQAQWHQGSAEERLQDGGLPYAGPGSRARDANAFVEVPAGRCEKIAGGAASQPALAALRTPRWSAYAATTC